MKHQCCFCGREIEAEAIYTLSIRKEGCGTEQELYCHEECLESALHDPRLLYLKVL